MVAALATFTYAMLLYPDVQTRAREALDQAIGSDQLPGLADQSDLPYITAVMKEVLRHVQNYCDLHMKTDLD